MLRPTTDVYALLSFDDVEAVLALAGPNGVTLTSRLRMLWRGDEPVEVFLPTFERDPSYWALLLNSDRIFAGLGQVATAFTLLHRGLYAPATQLHKLAYQLLAPDLENPTVASALRVLRGALESQRVAVKAAIQPGVEDHDRGQYAAALAVYASALDRFPDDALILYEIAYTEVVHLQNPVRATTAYRKVLTRDPFFRQAITVMSESDQAIWMALIQPMVASSAPTREQVADFAAGTARLGMHWHAANACLTLMHAAGSDYTRNHAPDLIECLVALGVVTSTEPGPLGRAVEHPDPANSRPSPGRPHRRVEGSSHAEESAIDDLRDQRLVDEIIALTNEASRLVESSDHIRARSLLIRAERVARALSADPGRLLASVLLVRAETEAALSNVGTARQTFQQAISRSTQSVSDSEDAVDRPWTAAERSQAQKSPERAAELAWWSNVRALIHRAEGNHERTATDLKDRLTFARLAHMSESDIAGIENALGLTLSECGQWSDAGSHLRAALGTRRRIHGDESLQVATTNSNLALLAAQSGEPDGLVTARELLRATLAVRRKAMPVTDPTFGQTLTNLAFVHADLGDDADAAELLYEAAHHEFNAVTAFAGINEEERLAMIRRTAGAHGLLARIAASGTVNAKVQAQALEVLVNSKALASGLTAARNRAITRTGQQRRSEIWSSRLASLVVRGLQGKDLDQYLAEINHAEEHYRAEILAEDARGLHSEMEWTTAALIRRELPAGAVLVDISIFLRNDGPMTARTEGSNAREHYLQTIVSPERVDQMIDLGPKQELDRLVAEFQYEIEMYGSTPRIPPVLAAAAERTRTICSRIWDQTIGLSPAATSARHLVLSLDGNIALFAFACAVIPGGKYALEKYRITQVVAISDLVPPRDTTEAREQVVIAFGNPDFGRHFDTANASVVADGAETHLPERTASTPRDDRRSIRTPMADELARNWLPLPATQAEVDIAAQYADTTGARFTPSTGSAADKTALTAVAAPTILHLATHAYYLREAHALTVKTREGDPMLTVQAPVALRSGLVLAGANERRNLPISSPDDGIMTAFELAGLHLEGTHLVLLSGCETAKGSAVTGDTVHGLRRACHIAGARTVIGCLWQIPDELSSHLIREMYERLAGGEGPADALRAAMLSTLMSLRTAEKQHPHPHEWAAWTLSGDIAAALGAIAGPFPH